MFKNNKQYRLFTDIEALSSISKHDPVNAFELTKLYLFNYCARNVQCVFLYSFDSVLAKHKIEHL